MAQKLRGEIYWADLDPATGDEQAGRRPVLTNLTAGTDELRLRRDCAISLSSEETSVEEGGFDN